MDGSNSIPPLNTTQISYPSTKEDVNKTNVSSAHPMPLIRLPAGSPLFSPGPRSTMFQSSHVFSPFPPLTPSSSSSAPVENIDSSIRFNNNLSLPPMMSHPTGINNNLSRPLVSPSIGFNINSSLPPMIPSIRYKPLRVSDNTLPLGKAHKRSKSDIIGLNSMIPHKGKEGVSEMKSDEELFEEEFSAYKNFNFSAFNFNENEDEIRPVQEYDPSSKHNTSVSLDSCFTNNFKKPPLPPLNFTGKVSSTTSVHGNDIDGSDYKDVRRILANRESAARSKERKKQNLAHLKHKVMTLEIEKYTLSTEFSLFEKKKMALMSENKYLTIQLESKKQHMKLAEAMNKQLNDEVKRLKAAATLKQHISAQIQQLNMAKAMNEQLSEELQQLNVKICEMMQNPMEFETSNMQPPN
ncbi:bZIP transcription factor 29 [Cardamine amara subsp. amara]|uniref:BZIP transcription factor 29 n=1 Tax=Cardamine amara subsp. amara TaxID=228776 RepID=A0ABD0ZMI8_CARAN